MKKEVKIFHIIVLLLLMVLYGFLFAQKIDLTTSDLGRHIKNGQLIIQGNFKVLNTNFYSYTEPNFPTINHHWGSGVIFYLIWKYFGFAGLSIFYVFIALIIFYILFKIAQKESNFTIAFLLSLLLIPLMVARKEVRPEIFTYLFACLFFWILWSWDKNQLNNKWLFFLPVMEIFWVNIHIYFILGPILVGIFWIKEVIKKSQKLTLILLLTFLATLINPFGIKGSLYPFNIFKNYAYLIVENQSVWFLKNWGMHNPNLTLFEIIFACLVLSFIILMVKNPRRFSFVYFSLASIFSAMAWLAIRNFAIFAFFALPITAYNVKKSFENHTFTPLEIQFIASILTLTLIFIGIFVYYPRLILQKTKFGLGLMPGNNQSARFFKNQNLQGPIFNNYDIGGYLIYHLYPQEKVFVDNRPEAYSISHFQKIYIPCQQDNSLWKKLDKKYNFNAIFFSYHDLTNWGQKFLIERIKDNNWAPVFADNYAIIFAKRNKINQSVIEKYEIPRNYFRIIKNE